MQHPAAPAPASTPPATSGPSRPRWDRVASIGLLAAFATQLVLIAVQKSPTFDEPPHLAAGLSYVTTGEFRLNRQHPPLVKELAALPLAFSGVRLPITDPAWEALTDPAPPHVEWQLGNALLSAHGPSAVLLPARLVCVGLAVALAWLLHRLARHLFGTPAALAALALFVLDPTVLGHATWITTDVGVALGTVLWLGALWRYLEAPSGRRLAGVALALGVALATKYSALVLVPLTGVFLVIDALRTRRFAAAALAFVSIGVGAAIVVQLCYGTQNGAAIYLDGLRRVNADHAGTYQTLLAGEFAPRFASYYAIALALKEPLPVLVAAALGVGLIVAGSRAAPRRALFVLLPPLAFFALYTVASDNLGVRYMLPLLPFVHLSGGVALGAGWERGGWRRALSLGAVVWMAVSSVAVHPDQLAYFNELACSRGALGRISLDGGTSCGPMWLDDSNVDWGQGLVQLRAWTDEQNAHDAHFAYFGSAPAGLYGLRWPATTLAALETRPATGRYIVSAHILARLWARLDARYGETHDHWLRHLEPTAVIGHAYYVYDVP